MRFFRRPLFKLATWIVLINFNLAALASTNAAPTTFAVIGNPKVGVSALTQTQLSNLYLGKVVSLPKNVNLVPVDQTNSSLYDAFYENILGWSSSEVSGYWSSMVFSGQATRPQAVSSDREAIQAVEQDPDIIAYVDTKSLKGIGDHVKILYGQVDPSFLQPDPSANVQVGFTGNSRPNSGYHVAGEAPPQSVSNYAPRTTNTSSHPSNSVNSAMLNDLQDFNSNAAGDDSQDVWHEIQQNIHLTAADQNPKVEHDIVWLLAHRSTLNKTIQNATPYIAYVYQQTQKRHMPAKFALLPMIESGYNPYAYSSVGAAGLWQLMPGTASSYGLNIDWWFDQRRDIITSTNAALDYLVQLHSRLGSWDLAAAGYNAGGGAVSSSIYRNRRAGKPTDFWDLSLPMQTENYVPELLAFATIIKNPEKYHVTLPKVSKQTFFTPITVKSQLDKKQIAQFAGIPESLVDDLNAGMERFATRPSGEHVILVPTTKVTHFLTNLASHAGQKHISWQYHLVRHGETLSKIAREYHTSLGKIEKVNGIKAAPSGQGILVPIWLNRNFSQVHPEVVAPSHSVKVDTSNTASGKIPLGALPSATATPSQQASPAAKMPDDSLKALVTKVYGKPSN